MKADMKNLSREQLLELAKQLKDKAHKIPQSNVSDRQKVTPLKDRKKTVITVDDSRLIHRRIQTILEPMGFEVVDTAMDGMSGVEKVLLHKPALVLLDYQMPVLDGIQTAIEIRKLDSEVKIIVVSGTLIEEVATSLLLVGVNDIMVKPINVPKLKESLASIGFNIDPRTATD